MDEPVGSAGKASGRGGSNEARSWTHLPAGWLAAPRKGSLPAPVPFRAMIGPGIILVGLSIGSGEFVLWPRLTAEYGFAVFWACWIGCTIQFFLNMEIERYTLATGESAVTGFVRLWWGLGPIFLVCATLPWIWPGWASAGAELITWQLGGSVLPIATGGLVLCGLVLTIGPVVYRTVETVQMVLVGLIFTLVLVLAFVVVDAPAVVALLRGAVAVGHVPEGLDMPLLLGALAFAGAGGTGNLTQSNYIKDKGYGMGHHIGRITSPLTGRDEPEAEVGFALEATEENRRHWDVWWRRANWEQGLSFWALCMLSLALFCLLTYSLIGGEGEPGAGLAFVADQAAVLDERFGPWARHTFVWAGIAVLFSTELGILDAVSRVVVDLLKDTLWRGDRGPSASRLYLWVLWGFIASGVLILVSGIDQPLQLLVISASLNALVMFLYSGLLLWLGWRVFEPPLRPRPLRVVALLGAFGFFGYFSVVTVVDQARRLFS